MSKYYMRLDGGDNAEQRPRQRLRILFILSVILNLALFWLLMTQLNGNSANVPYIYSPAQHVVSYEIVKFTRGVADDIPIYERRPSPAVDEAWSALYSVAQTKISRSEALKMPNRTWPLLAEKGSYVFALDMFHQLHCLDTLRKQLSPGHNYTHVSGSHIRHCIGAIRQALMCSADISTIVWQWSDKLQIAEQRDDVVHVCRDFNRIREWASERTFVDEDSDFSVYIEDDLSVPVS
ncbi:hypothetical protein C8R44DRAFT_804772 [Mycena epipterygia]|nr:hypothetical protein C8R44DRAFT_804760 [Mycena epipterygia]KAJ7107563.1 hypothetical protein C8R44DRAFT_804772 [Mycena epipterygia]